MKYKIVMKSEAGLVAHDFEADDGDAAIRIFEAKGFAFVGLSANQGQRPELVGEPKFAGLCGPMWGGMKNGEPVIRYEELAAYEKLSR